MTAIPSASPSSTRTTAVIVVIIAFVAGLFAGFAGDRFYLFRSHRLFPSRRMAEFASRRIVDRLDHELDLNTQQETEVQQILDRHRARIDAIMGGIRPQMRQELDAANAEIEKVLTPQQRVQFSKMRMRMRMPGGRRGMGPRP